MKRCIITGAIFTGLTLGTLLIGCGDLNQQPIAPAAALRGDGGKGPSDGLSTLVFSVKAPDQSTTQARAAKPTVHRQVSRTFSPNRDGELEVEFDDDDDGSRGAVRVKKVAFNVKARSINRAYRIDMGVSAGPSLEDVAVTFSPSGIVFNPPASLRIVVRGRVDASKCLAYHTHGSSVTRIPVSASYDDGETEILLQVPGFSVYSLDDSRAPEGDTGW